MAMLIVERTENGPLKTCPHTLATGYISVL